MTRDPRPVESVETCPKHMVYGPCGGVRPDLSCELDPLPCPFAPQVEPVRWTGPRTGPRTGSAGASRLLRAALEGPVVLTDLTVPPFDTAAVAAVTEILRGSADALLVGEHKDLPDFSPTLMAHLVRRSGGNPWLTLTCRDRNRLVLGQELASLQEAGADGVLCVTGDGRTGRTTGGTVDRTTGDAAGVTAVFDLDGTRLAALAASYGVGVAVAESPAAAPHDLRPGRLVQKQLAGAQLAILNHVGSVQDVRRFLAAARDAGLTIPVIAAVPVYTDARSAQVLANLPGLELDGHRAARVLGAADPEAAGIEAAVEQAGQLLEIEGVAGVNLSGMASSQGVLHAAELKAEIGGRIR